MVVYGILYLLICLFFGVQLMRFIFPDKERLFLAVATKKSSLALLPTALFYYPAGFIVGLVIVTFVTYWMAFFMNPFIPESVNLLYPANIVSGCLAIYAGSLLWQKSFLRQNPDWQQELQSPDNNAPKPKPSPVKATLNPLAKDKFRTPKFYWSRKTAVFFTVSITLFTIAATVLFFYSFYATDGKIFSGYSVFSDFAPHTALISSFSKGINFPTEYPHFPGEGIRYHFFFFFLAGILNTLGMRLDFALNVPSILVFVSCFILLGVLAVLLSGKRVAFLLAPVLVLFRSSLAIFTQIGDLAAAPGATPISVISGIFSNTKWIGDTLHDDWGLWSINVYANQRHLLLGVAMMLILVFLFLPHLRRMFLHMRKTEGFKAKCRLFLFSREAWLPRKKDPLRPYSLVGLALLIVICMPYFHGSALIGALLILFFMAIFSESRLSYLVVALVAVGSSFIQSQIFSGGAANVVAFGYQWGFLIDNPTVLNMIIYLGKIMGVASILIFVLIFTQRSAYRTIVLLAFSLPLLFAFIFSVTVDITANHKFIQMSFILFSIYIASLLLFLWQPFSKLPKRPYDAEAGPQSKASPVHSPSRTLLLIGSRSLAVLLFLVMTATGISEWVTYFNYNQNRVSMDLKSPLVSWLIDKTDARSVFLTAPYAMNTFFLSGRFTYFGHPYYAWSAGYDTQAREEKYRELLTGCGGDVTKFRTLCKQEGISYVLVDNEMRGLKDYQVDVNFFQNNLTIVSSMADASNTIVYRVG